jgi:hypothetical protein
MIGARVDDQTTAKQVAVASFTRYGFEAAAVTALGVRSQDERPRARPGSNAQPSSGFDHPYAAIAISGHPNARTRATRFAGLPLFSAWIAAPTEADEGVEST